MLIYLKPSIARLQADRSGNVAIVFALMAIVLMPAVGAAVDIGRWLHARDQTQGAADAAVLAGGRWLQTNSTDTAGAIAAAQNFYKQEVATRLPVLNDSISFAVSSDGQTVYANGTAYIKTPFLQFAGISQLPIIPLGQQPVAQATLAVGGNGGQNLEVAMMLDITGSMAGQKLSDLQTSATDLVNIIVWSDQSQFTSKVAIVPFTEDIRLPKLRRGGCADFNALLNVARTLNASLPVPLDEAEVVWRTKQAWRDFEAGKIRPKATDELWRARGGRSALTLIGEAARAARAARRVRHHA